MQHLLEKVLPAGQSIAADDKHRLVLVQGSPSEMQLAEDTVKVFDIDQLSGTSMALLPLRNADPVAMVEELRNIFSATRKEADTDSIRFMAISRLNAVMVITQSGRYLDDARTWVARLDRVQDLNERRVYVYNLQYAKAVQIGEKLQGLLTGLNIQFKPPAATGDTGLAPTAPGFEGPAKPLPPPVLVEPPLPPAPLTAPCPGTLARSGCRRPRRPPPACALRPTKPTIPC